MKRCIRAAILAACCLLAPAIAHAELTPEQAASTLTQASEHFRKGASLLDSSREEAAAELSASIDAFERLISEGGIRNGRLYYNVGNAYLLKGDLGRAILNFKRAQRFIPGDANLEANLAHARQRVASRIDAPAEERVRRALLFWHDETPAKGRYAAFLLAYTLAWSWAILRLAKPNLIGGWWPSIAFAVISLCCLGSLLVERRALLANAEAVIVADQAVGRKGPDAIAYEPSFTEPLHPGVEITIVERRPGWVLARLADGRQSWFEDAAVESAWPVNQAL